MWPRPPAPYRSGHQPNLEDIVISHDMAHELAVLRGVELRRAAEEYRRWPRRDGARSVRSLLRAALAPPGPRVAARDGA